MSRRSVPRSYALALLWLLLAAAPAPPSASAAVRSIVLTGPVFPAGFGLGVAADPLGLQGALWTPLVGFDDRLAPFAALATRVPTLANGDVKVLGQGMQVTVHLKPDLRFSDGSRLSADDVLFGLDLQRDPAIGNTFGLDEIARAAAPDSHTVLLTFGDLYGAYLAYAMPPALPRAYLRRKYHTNDLHQIAQHYAQDPYNSPTDVFSGPYSIQEVAQGQRLTLRPNRYFSALPLASGRPRPELRYTLLSNDEGAVARALHARTTDVDLALGLGPATLPALVGLDPRRLRLQTRSALAVEHLELNQAAPALRDLRVRRALQVAIDKRALARAVFPAPPNAARLAATTLIPASSPYHDPTARVSAYDPALARALLRQAGYATTPTGPGRRLSLDLAAPNDPTRRREVDLLTRSWSAVGVRVTARLVSASPADRGGMYAPYELGGVLATRRFDLALFDLRLGPDPATVASLFDPDRAPTALAHGAYRRNYTGIAVEALAALPETAQASFAQDTRRRGYVLLQSKVNQLLPYIVLYERPQIVVASPSLLNLRPGPQDGGVFWNCWQWARAA